LNKISIGNKFPINAQMEEMKMDNKKPEQTNNPQEVENQDLEFNIEEVEQVIAPALSDDGIGDGNEADGWSNSCRRWCC
jgi:hypothetical protein